MRRMKKVEKMEKINKNSTIKNNSSQIFLRHIKSKKYIILICVIVTLAILAKVSYAIYESNLKVTYTSNVGNMICDINVEKNDSYTVNGIPYFIVTVKNYDESGNITAMDMDYTVTIQNEEGSNGIFIWKNESDNNYIDTYSSQVTTTTYSFGKEKKEERFKVFVKTANNSEEDVNIEAVLNAVQVAK